MRRTRVKICGICRVEDALAAARCGADAVGMVFHPSARRHVARERAKRIIDALPAFVTPVALFVDAPSRDILDVAEELRLRHVQLHGHESPEQVAELRGLAVIKAIRVETGAFRVELDRWRRAIRSESITNLQGLVLETAGTGQAGGTGIENNWAEIESCRQSGEFDDLPPMIAAGGLSPDNAGDIVRRLRPWAVDVSSGVESAIGTKSIEKIERFVEVVRQADASG